MLTSLGGKKGLSEMIKRETPKETNGRGASRRVDKGQRRLKQAPLIRGEDELTARLPFHG